jgi:uncharacterized membrane protein YdjX (TVP38/TMEM64 family)
MRRRLIAISLLVVAALAALALVDPEAAVASLSQAGPAEALLFFAFYVVSALLLLPGSLLTLAAGFLFGMWGGLALTSISSTAAALAAFLVGRHLAHDLVSGRLGGSPKLAALSDAVSQGGFTVVLLTRLSPLFPYNVLNYLFSLTQVRTRDYALASWLGMLPGTALYVSIGATARSLGELSASGPPSPARLGLLGLGVLTTLAVTALLTRRARAILAQRTELVADAP